MFRRGIKFVRTSTLCKHCWCLHFILLPIRQLYYQVDVNPIILTYIKIHLEAKKKYGIFAIWNLEQVKDFSHTKHSSIFSSSLSIHYDSIKRTVCVGVWINWVTLCHCLLEKYKRYPQNASSKWWWMFFSLPMQWQQPKLCDFSFILLKREDNVKLRVKLLYFPFAQLFFPFLWKIFKWQCRR